MASSYSNLSYTRAIGLLSAKEKAIEERKTEATFVAFFTKGVSPNDWGRRATEAELHARLRPVFLCPKSS